jgi:hypothetical protein
MQLAVWLVSTCLSAAGCAGIPIHSEDGISHHLVIGIGMVSTKEQQGVSVEDARILGLMIGKGGFNAGIGQQHTVEIDPNTASNTVISIRATPFSLTVTNFSIHDTNQTNDNSNREGNAAQ